jgi:hypothetical protein
MSKLCKKQNTMKTEVSKQNCKMTAKRCAFLDITIEARRTKTKNYLLVEKSLTTLLKQK